MEMMDLVGRKVVVVGWGESAAALLSFLQKQGASSTLFDFRDGESLQKILADSSVDLTGISIEAQELSARSRQEAELFVVTPGHVLPNDWIVGLRERGAQVVSELEFVSRYINAPLVVVTGTNGKYTTTRMLAEMLKEQGRRAFANVDQPLAAVLNQNQPEFVLARADSTQVALVDRAKPAMTLLLNIHAEHPEIYSNIDAVSADYQRIFKNADASTLTVLNAGDARIALFYQNTPGRKIFFSSKELPEVWEGSWANKTHLCLRRALGMQPEMLPLSSFRHRGDHNRENLMSASLAALQMGVSLETIQKVIDGLRAPQNRVQFVKRHNSVAFYNDSACSNPDALLRTLHAFNEPIILISGGRDHGADYLQLTTHVRQKVKNMILVGEAKEAINRVVGDFTETFLVGTVEEAVMMAYQKSRSGDVILFSPGCDHSDQFPSIEAKGEYFASLVDQMTRPRNRVVFY